MISIFSVKELLSEIFFILDKVSPFSYTLAK